ncbi:hypothetical protein LTR28_011970 [Elasticomyces elasticus]|nr:hypothetical protein LTR28_011970 [Elasticomyces elasticus]
MTDEQVCALAAEPKTIMQDRLRLETRHATLEAGQEAFRSALVFASAKNIHNLYLGAKQNST